MRTTASIETVQEALARVNRQYEGNIEFKHIGKAGRQVDFTLTVRSSRGPGGRRGHSGRRIAAACWHVHGHLFEAILELDPEAKIVSSMATITRHGGNWQDRNIGSMVSPLYYSEACDCGYHPNLKAEPLEECQDCFGVGIHTANCYAATQTKG